MLPWSKKEKTPPKPIDYTQLVIDYHARMKIYILQNSDYSPTDIQDAHINITNNLIQQLTSNAVQMLDLQKLLEQNLKSYLKASIMKLNWQDATEEEVAIGIDLGTVNSVTAAFVKGDVNIIPSDKGERNTPSRIAFLKDGNKSFGNSVEQYQFKDPQNTVQDVKRIIGRKKNDKYLDKALTKAEFTVDFDNELPKIHTNGGKLSPEEISGMLLADFKRVAEAWLNVTIKKAVITVPAYFNDDQRNATKKAGEIAGFEVLGLLNEPTAAAIAYKLQRLNERARNVVIFDLGGGTFDVAVLQIDDKIEVRSIGGDAFLGGIDFDHKLMKYCIDKYEKADNKSGIENLLNSNDQQSRRHRARLLKQCEEAKKELSFTATPNQDAPVYVPGIINGDDFEVGVTRAEFENLIQDDVLNIRSIMIKCLEEASVDPEGIDDVVLVGGATRMPAVKKMLTDFFPGRQLNVSINCDEAVAYGAAMQAALINGAQISGSFLNFSGIQDITPMSLGVAARIDKEEGRFSKLIKKNSKIPAENSQEYGTFIDDQKYVRIKVYQGESSYIADNICLGEFILSGIPPGKAGFQKINVIMRVTEMGTVHVVAECRATGLGTAISLNVTKTNGT